MPFDKWPSKFKKQLCLLDSDEQRQTLALSKLPDDMPSPSEDFTNLVQKRPIPLESFKATSHPMDIGHWTKPHMGQKYQGIIWYYPNEDVLDLKERECDLLFLASKGWVVFDIKLESLSPTEVRNKIIETLPLPELTKLPQIAVVINPDDAVAKMCESEEIAKTILVTEKQVSKRSGETLNYFLGKVPIKTLSAIILENPNYHEGVPNPIINSGSSPIPRENIKLMAPENNAVYLQTHQDILATIDQMLNSIKFTEINKL